MMSTRLVVKRMQHNCLDQKAAQPGANQTPWVEVFTTISDVLSIQLRSSKPC